MKRNYFPNWETDADHEKYYRDIVRAEQRAVPNNEGWQPDPMHEYDPADAWLADDGADCD